MKVNQIFYPATVGRKRMFEALRLFKVSRKDETLVLGAYSMLMYAIHEELIRIELDRFL